MSGISVTALLFFITTLSRDAFLSRRLKLNKSYLILNFSFIIISLGSLSLIIYLFILLKEQIGLIA
nr:MULTISPECIES: hypothetical protein [Enterococcus]